MKTRFILTSACLLLGGLFVYAQDAAETWSPSKKHQVWVHLKNDLGLYKGLIHATSPTELIVRARRKPQIDTFHYSDLQLIETRPKKRVSNGTLIGSGVGLAFGIIVGKAVGESNTDTSGEAGIFTVFEAVEKASYVFTGASIGMMSGGAVGALIGSKKDEFIIDGDKKNFTILRLALNPPGKSPERK